MGGGLTFQPELRTINVLVCWVLLVKKAATLGAALIAAPSTGLPEYLRTVSTREISSLHGNKAQLPVKPLYAQKKERFKRQGVNAAILTVFRSVCVVITLAVFLMSMPVAVVVVRPCAVQCLVTGRPVWGCNNSASTARAPDSMLLKVHYK